MIVVAAAGCILAVLAVAFIIFPLIRPNRSATAIRSAEGLLARRDRVYGELRELEFDRDVGKLSSEDYEEARTRLETEAARILRALDARASTVDDEIEREVRELRENRSICRSCGEPVTLGARFCPACGADRSVASRR
ncbi:MAG TPA: c-type cytochrome biogenesis protein CcmI [Chloroflexota bacterium]|nr:c-type cytochrome biogenesis protein CcmI [Chloroflexota bacterium]